MIDAAKHVTGLPATLGIWIEPSILKDGMTSLFLGGRQSSTNSGEFWPDLETPVLLFGGREGQWGEERMRGNNGSSSKMETRTMPKAYALKSRERGDDESNTSFRAFNGTSRDQKEERPPVLAPVRRAGPPSGLQTGSTLGPVSILIRKELARGDGRNRI